MISCSFRIFRLIGRFSKYDFWIPGEISDRHRCSEKFSSKNFVENFFHLSKTAIFKMTATNFVRLAQCGNKSSDPDFWCASQVGQ